MNNLTTGLTALVALLHVWFMLFEMVFWTRPLGRKALGLTEEQAQHSKVLAFNQGLYNGFLAAGLIAGLVLSNPDIAHAFRMFFLACVVIAGVVGGISSTHKIFWIQALPGILALAASWS